jgi:hypothetical protein
MNGNGQGHATGKEPVERVIDLFVHTPIGLAVMAWKRVPEFVVTVPDLVGQAVAKGCAQLAEAEGRLSEEVRKARMIGQVAVTFGGRQLRREVDARLRDVRQAAGGVRATTTPSAPVMPSAPVSPPAPAPPVTKPAGATKAPAKATGARKATKAAPAKSTSRTTRRPATAPTSAADPPIREYDGLSASQVVSRLTGLTPEELRAVRAYEEASRARRTVVLAIDRLLG